ncbi:hypothetical protein [Chitinophaga sp. CF418]|uniref:hypothetical protein n=1 Tax=Chitinophaga sp. CF418 TaxID=1855287 RepID=UPI00091ACAF2|nr:hypothetical protein [Chitinophaga sp. CF418]SHM83354.1 hypothetical protein SAMN05216311_103397 [Chitinophaga sp. CF418]
MEEIVLNIDDKAYVFTVSHDAKNWHSPESDIVAGHLLEFLINIEQTRDALFSWEDVAAFISNVHKHNSWYVERIAAAKGPVLGLCRSFFKDGIDEEQDRHLDLDPGIIEYKGYSTTAAGERVYHYAIHYLLSDARDPYEDMGMYLWCAAFAGGRITGVKFDL